MNSQIWKMLVTTLTVSEILFHLWLEEEA
jgi:hypothetical protein